MENFLPKPSRIVGVDLSITDEITRKYSALVVERKGAKIKIVGSLIEATDLDELHRKLSAYGVLPVCLSVSGKGTLIKKTSFQDNIANTMQQVFPGVHPKEFYIQEISTSAGQMIVLTRKERINEIIQSFSKIGLLVIQYSAGPFNALSIFNALNVSNETITLDKHQFVITDGQLSEYQISAGEVDLASQAKFKFDVLEIEMNSMIAFSNAFSYLVSDSGRFEYDASLLELNLKSENNFRHRLLFKKMGWAALLITFVLLFGNFVLYNKISDTHSELSSTLTYNSDQLKKLNSLNQMIESRQKFLDESGWTNNQRVSFFADRLAASLPASLKLNMLTVFPLSKPDRSNPESIFFKPGQLRITGFSADNNQFNEWMNHLKKNEWVDEMQVINFKKNTEEKLDEFDLLVKIKNAE